MKRFLSGSMIILSVLTILMLFQAAAAEKNTHVVILGTSDMHGNVLGWSYEDGKETGNSGMARLYSYIRQTRTENPVTFLIDAGDEN